jgi:MazG family protein
MTDNTANADSPGPGGEAGRRFQQLVDIMRTLRAPDGCPWDREQTLASIGPFVIEEAYEVVDAIQRGDLQDLRGEIGDLIFEGVFLAQICDEQRAFSATESLEAVIDKLVRRHPHVFERAAPGGAAALERADQVREQWERVKERERTARGDSQSLLAGIPRSLPALLRAFDIGSRAAAVGFDWPRVDDIVDKIDEEVAELRHAIGHDPAHVQDELGDDALRHRQPRAQAGGGARNRAAAGQ